MLDQKLTTFLAVIETGSYTAAAKRLHLTQPAVTQHIQKLEEHYGCQLFTQEGRAMRLTKDGEFFLHYTKMQQSNERQLVEKLEGNHRPLYIGSTLSIADYYLPPMLYSFLEKNNGGLNITVANTKVLLESLLQGKLDAAFIEGIFDRKLFEAEVFCIARFIPVVSKKHPLLNKKIDLSDLYSYPLILREFGSGTRAIFESYLAQQNDSITSFASTWEVSSFVLIKHLLENTNAVSFMYEAVAGEEISIGELGTLEIADYQVSHPLQFVYLKNSLDQDKIMTFYSQCVGLQ
ncbi:LysR family transcriptional regulator [Anaerotignum sp. MB30-C6]|uniref:LysR family transcriptional regulator n=1 Tax=Anaerotignum sp. MB30-C6 TaxID=3070814 RepID=UPI0027DCD751|nr:LysR family transcriptional regulator [Anaerotignum sp. MB30-C6]WMI79873.1 LysR family transcriptional regulator [Anaerotignum sp. MB30-C6]